MCLLTDNMSFRNISKLKKNILEAVEGGVNFLIIRDTDHDLTFLKDFVNDLKKDLPPSIPISINVGLSKAIPQGIKSIHLPEKSQLYENDYQAIVGRSVHSLESALLAEKRGADYLIAGTIYPTNTHPDKLPDSPYSNTSRKSTSFDRHYPVRLKKRKKPQAGLSKRN